MLPGGKEAQLHKENLQRYMTRKGGYGQYPAATCAQFEASSQWLHQLHRLPHGRPLLIQNDNGSFPHLPGYDDP